MTVSVWRYSDLSRGGNFLRIDVTRPGEGLAIKGVDISLPATDEQLADALRVLNKSIAAWPVEPVTVEQVREMA